jgi:L-talarate/galactarate dehydratase
LPFDIIDDKILKILCIRGGLMKVVKMQTTALALPRPNGSQINPIVVELKTDSGLEGFGVCYAFGGFQVNSLKASIDDLERVVIGQDITRWARTFYDLHAALRHTGQWGGYGLNAIGAIDTAFWDLRAKALNLPLARLLGGFRDEVPCYASNWLWAALSVDELQEQAADLVKKGFHSMKMKMGGLSHKVNVARFKAVREAVGENVDIMVEGHWGWTVSEAIRMGRALEPYNIFWLEDPLGPPGNQFSMEDTKALAQVAAALDCPVAAGETFSTRYGFRRIVEDKAVDIVIVDVLRAGGITEWLKVAALLDTYNLPMVSHCLPDISLSVIAGLSNGYMVEYMPWWDEIYKEPLQPVNGNLRVPDKPGLGLELDRKVLQKFKM